MFSNDEDPASVKTARAIERAYMRKWVEEAYVRSENAELQSFGRRGIV